MVKLSLRARRRSSSRSTKKPATSWAWVSAPRSRRTAFPRAPRRGSVAYINPGVDAQRGSVEVKLDVAEPPSYLRQDMTVSVGSCQVATPLLPWWSCRPMPCASRGAALGAQGRRGRAPTCASRRAARPARCGCTEVLDGVSPDRLVRSPPSAQFDAQTTERAAFRQHRPAPKNHETLWLPFEWIVACAFCARGRLQTMFIISGAALGVAVIVFIGTAYRHAGQHHPLLTLNFQAHIVICRRKKLPGRCAKRAPDADLACCARAAAAAAPEVDRPVASWSRRSERMPRGGVAPVASGPGLVVRGDANRRSSPGIEPESCTCASSPSREDRAPARTPSTAPTS